MKSLLRYLIFALAGVFLVSSAHAEEYKGSNGGNKSTKEIKNIAAGCLQGSSFKYLDVNNVRVRINSGGDMWWDFEKGDYEIPAGSGKTSMFSASLWIGGMDKDENLKLAAIRYRSGPTNSGTGDGTDYFPGPLNTDGTASTDAVTCAEWDKLFAISRNEVDDYLAWWNDKESFDEYTIPKSITDWPAHGDISKGQSFYIAPFFDADGDLVYDPNKGDFPYYDVTDVLCNTPDPTYEELHGGTITSSILSDQVIKGDQTLWWVFNDMGNIHTETEGEPIGLEIRAQAFGFTTNDVINDMTFYSYEIVNRSTFPLYETYFSQWVDTDLGHASDDYVGCDVDRGLGFCYNGKEEDGSGQSWAYGKNPPAIGVDFFQGPYIDADGYDNPQFSGDCDIVGSEYLNQNYLDPTIVLGDDNYDSMYAVAVTASRNDQMTINGVNFGDGLADNERFGMRRFVYHNNQGPDQTSDPNYAPEYYNYLKGIWKDQSKMVYGGNGHSAAGGYGPECDFMFPGLTDKCDWGTGGVTPENKEWTEVTANNAAADRRFMQSAGPFTLESGAVNYITVGIPWARANNGGPSASVELLKLADDKCQNLFENCFRVINGPNAPDMTIREMDHELIIYLTNRKFADLGNNYQEKYEEYDPNIVFEDGSTGDSTYNFEGYQVYQIIDPTVSVADLYDVSKSRLVFQSDIKNDVGRLINYESDADLGALVPRERVDGENIGIQHSIKIDKDEFTGEYLVNNKQYYYIAVAYAYNEYHKYTDDPSAIDEGVTDLYGQKNPYLGGRKNIRSYTAIPHKNIGTVLNAVYGDGLALTRVEGKGNGGNWVELTDETVDEIMAKPALTEGVSFGDAEYPMAYSLDYVAGNSPIAVSVIDPVNLKKGNFRIAFDTLYNYLVHDVTGTPGVLGDTSTKAIGEWYIENIDTQEKYFSDTTILVKNEQIFLDLGLSVNIGQVYGAGNYEIGETSDGSTTTKVFASLEENHGLIGATVEVANPLNQWFYGLPDLDGADPLNWIRAGSQIDIDHLERGTDAAYLDEGSKYEAILTMNDMTIAPFVLCQTKFEYKDLAIGYNDLTFNDLNRLSDLNNVDLVFTGDKSKWTRCPVIEMSKEKDSAEGKAKQMFKRKGKSVNIDGEVDVESADPMMNSSYIDSVGMGWFPGYAIDVLTGERLNMMFGEDSDLESENGRDMLWNPTTNLLMNDTTFVYGGKHVVWVMRNSHREDVQPWGQDTTFVFNSGPYDAGSQANVLLSRENDVFILPSGGEYAHPKSRPLNWVYAACTWATVPLKTANTNWLEGDIKIKLRVTTPYSRFSANAVDSATIADYSVNRFYPMYEFSTGDFVPQLENVEQGKSDLDKINVVPNPYYGYSEYEVNQLDNRVKITALPKKCVISIYTLDGTLLRQFDKSDEVTYMDWDLKNYSGIPISGGMYYIHVDAGELGERVVKFYAVMRPVDLNAF
ncbi:MAG: hypothetical protein JEZ03_00340 [Bacteroidales bacterium]|nr:hypothetical protein [Bacteroidales bacterium]